MRFNSRKTTLEMTFLRELKKNKLPPRQEVTQEERQTLLDKASNEGRSAHHSPDTPLSPQPFSLQFHGPPSTFCIPASGQSMPRLLAPRRDWSIARGSIAFAFLIGPGTPGLVLVELRVRTLPPKAFPGGLSTGTERTHRGLTLRARTK